MNDAQLIEAFQKDRSEGAFRSLVERHLPLVIGTARRITGDHGLAEEVAQTVFILLARKASSFRAETIVPGWLYRTTCFVARRAVRAEQRRQRREQQAVAMQTNNDSTQSAANLAPNLDDALQRLSNKERNAVLLRFFEERPLSEVGANLGISEEAAKKRITRALEKLRHFFSRRGTQITSIALIGALAQESTKAAVSAAAVSKLTAAALAPTATSALLADVLAAWRWTKIKLALGVSSGVALTALVVSQAIPATAHKTGAQVPNPSLVTAGANAINSTAPTGAAPAESIQSMQVAGMTVPAHPLRITVLDAITGEPIRGVKVSDNFMFPVNPQDRPEPPHTDAKGCVTLSVPEHYSGDERVNQFEVYVNPDNYASRSIMWLSSTGSVFAIVTNDYTVRLDTGVTIGGTVVDDAGQPLEGIHVGASGNSYSGYSYSTDGNGKITSAPVLRVEDFPTFSLNSEAQDAITSDQNGKFQFEHFPPDLKSVIIDLVGPDGARQKYRTPQGQRLSAEDIAPVSFSDLRGSTARLLFPRGNTVEGVVVNTNGDPVIGATVSEGTQWGNLKILSHSDTDYAGRFWLSNRPTHEIILAASAEGYASASTIVAVKPGMETARIRLPAEKPLRARIVNTSSEPVGGATIRVLDIENEGLGLQWSGTSDSDGHVIWRAAPTNDVAYFITAENYPPRLAHLRAETNELLVTLNANQNNTAAYVTGKVADATSGKPVDNFTVKVRHDRWSDWEPGRATEGVHGGFSLTTSQSETPVGTKASYFLTVEAEGYEPYRTRWYEYDEGDQTLDISLQPGGSIEGIVRNPDGSPASDCQISVGTLGDRPFSFKPGEFSLYQNWYPPVQTDANGHYKLDKPLGLQSLIAFNEGGWALAHVSTNVSNLDLALLPWGHVEGVLMNGDLPAPNESIGINVLAPDRGNSIQLSQNTQTGEGGRFAFDKLPAGEYRIIWRQRRGDTLQTAVKVVAGETNHVVLKASGRTVAVKLLAPPSATITNWQDCIAVLNRDVSLPPPPSRADFITEESHMAAESSYAQDPVVLAAKENERTYRGGVSGNGLVTFENIPPGNYLLDVALPGDDRDLGEPKKLGAVKAAVTVPEDPAGGTNAIGLGTFTMEIY